MKEENMHHAKDNELNSLIEQDIIIRITHIISRITLAMLTLGASEINTSKVKYKTIGYERIRNYLTNNN